MLVVLAIVTVARLWSRRPRCAPRPSTSTSTSPVEGARSSTSPFPSSRWWRARTPRLAKLLASVAGNDLTLSGPLQRRRRRPGPSPRTTRGAATDVEPFAAAGAHAGVHGLLTIRGDRLEAEMRLYDLTTPEHRLIASREVRGSRRPSRGASPTRSPTRSCCSSPASRESPTRRSPTWWARAGAKEIVVADYDGAGATGVTRNGSINLSPVWSPDARSIAFTSYMNGLSRPLPSVSLRAAARSRRWPRSSGHQLVPRLEPRRTVPRAHAVEGRQPRDLRAHAGDRRAPASHPTRRHRHGADVVTDRPADRVRLRPRGQPRTCT